VTIWRTQDVCQIKKWALVAQHFKKSRSDEWKLASSEVAGLCENNFASRQGRWKADDDSAVLSGRILFWSVNPARCAGPISFAALRHFLPADFLWTTRFARRKVKLVKNNGQKIAASF
jgi:hypothetical protein